MTARPIRLLAGFATVGVWTMASRVLGFVRDILIAAFLGSGPVAEAFFVAFRLPNMFRPDSNLGHKDVDDSTRSAWR